MAARSEKITFKSASGEMLAGRLDLPENDPKAYAIWAHCFSCSKDMIAASRVAKGLTLKEIAVLRFDFTGLGSSEGDFANTNFSSNVDDLVAAADHLREYYEPPKILAGHSLGGAAVLACADQIPESLAVCTIGAPSDPAHVSHNFEDAICEIEEKGEAEVMLVGRPFKIKKQFLEDIGSQNLEKKIGNLKRALLVFHSPRDETVSVDNAATIYKSAMHPKSFVSLDSADHLLSGKEDAAYVADVMASWAERYIN